MQIALAVAYALTGDPEESQRRMELGEKMRGKEEADAAREFIGELLEESHSVETSQEDTPMANQ